MTLGERIQELRKQKNLSQEALGEALGVSRQAISKWEGDAAIPEVDKLVALSRLFGVGVGALLGVEPEESGAPEELTDRELRAVEAIVGRYLDEAERRGPKRRRWPWVLAAAVLIVALWTAYRQVTQINRSLDTLQWRVSNITDSFYRQIQSVTGQVEEILQKQNGVAAQSGWEIVDLSTDGTLTLRLYAIPREYTDGMTARFQVESPDFDTLSLEGTAQGTTFSCQAEVPPSDEIRLSVVFDDGTEKRTQVMDTAYDLKSSTNLDFWAYFTGNHGVADNRVWHLDGNLDISCLNLEYPVRLYPVSLRVQVRSSGSSGAAETVLDMDLGDWEGAPLTVPFQQDIPVAGGDRVEILGIVTDNYGRQSCTLIQGANFIEKDGRLDLDFDPRTDVGVPYDTFR